MRRLAHLSDLHFGRVDPAVVDGLLGSLHEARPDMIVISGDFTQRARRREYAAARAFIDQLPAPVFAVPGNHDLVAFDPVERMLDPYGRYRRYISSELEPVWQDEEVALVGIKSSRRLFFNLNWAVGRIGRRQLARALHRLDAVPPGLVRIVVVHHPLMVPEGPPDKRPPNSATHGAGRALRAFARRGVQLVLSGHLHLSYTRRHAALEGGEGPPAALLPAPDAVEVRAATAPSAAGPLIVQAASATSTRLRDEPNAYNWITIENGHATVEVRAWDGRRLFAAVQPVPMGTPGDQALAGVDSSKGEAS